MSLLRFRTAGVRVDLDCPDAEVAALVTEVGAAMLAGDDDAPAATLDARAVPGPDDDTPEQRAARLLSAVDQAALRHTTTLPLHAAALAGPAGCVVIPGDSGAGKTTLAAAAMQAGLMLLSDEAACFTEPLGTLVPHPRPLGISLGSRRLLGVDVPDDVDEEVAIPPSLFGATAPTDGWHRCVLVVLPSWAPEASARLEPIGRPEGLAALLAARLERSPDRPAWSPEAAWTYLTELVQGVTVARLHYDRPRDGAQVLFAALAAADG